MSSNLKFQVKTSVGKEVTKSSFNSGKFNEKQSGKSSPKGKLRNSAHGAPTIVNSQGTGIKKAYLTKGRHKNTTEMRVRLPPVEDFEEDLEFPAEGHSHIKMRLERLMGSGKINLLNKKYMKTLSERLAKEEWEVADVRSKVREACERERCRKLAVRGLLEPTTDMKDIYCDPDYMACSMMKRIENSLKKNRSKTQNFTRISAVEPFFNDKSGAGFKTYPGHGSPLTRSPSYSESKSSVRGYEPGTQVLHSDKEWNKAEGLKPNTYSTDAFAAESEGAEGLHVTFSSEEKHNNAECKTEDKEKEKSVVEPFHVDVLQTSQKSHKISYDDTLELFWKPFETKLFEDPFGMEETVNDLYHIGDEIVGIYQRELLIAEEAVSQLSKAIDQYQSSTSHAKGAV